MKKKTWIISATCGVLFLFLLIGPVRGVTIDQDLIIKEDPLLESRKDTIIDSKEYNEIVNDTLQPTVIQYTYIADLANTQNIVKDSDDFSGTVKLSNTKYRFYNPTTFYQDPTTKLWKNVNVATTSLTDWAEQVEKISFLDNLHWTIKSASAQYSGYAETSDGHIIENSTGQTFDQTHDSVTGDSLDDTSAYLNVTVKRNNATQYPMSRVFLRFDTSTISPNEIDSASLFVWTYQTPDTDNDEEVCLVQNLASDPDNLNVTDFDLAGDSIDNPTEGASRYDIDGMSALEYHEIVLNDTGESWIGTTTHTDLSLRIGSDCDDDNLYDVDDETDSILFASADQTGTANDPYLEVTYASTPDASSTPLGATSSTPFINDLLTITGYTEHYETSTATPDWYEYHYYRIPVIGWIIFYLIFWQVIGKRLLVELLIRWRKRKK